MLSILYARYADYAILILANFLRLLIVTLETNYKKCPSAETPEQIYILWQAYASPASLGSIPCHYHRRVDRTKFSTSKDIRTLDCANKYDLRNESIIT